MIEVRLFGPLRQVVARAALDAEPETTVAQVLSQLCQHHPALKPLLFDDADQFFPHIVILHEGQNVWSLKGLATSVKDGDRLALVYPIEGG